jgi:hypothetical protein
METIREEDIPTCSLIGMTEIVMADRPDPAQVHLVWQEKRMAPFVGKDAPAPTTRERRLLIVVDGLADEGALARVKAAVEARRREQLLG